MKCGVVNKSIKEGDIEILPGRLVVYCLWTDVNKQYPASHPAAQVPNRSNLSPAPFPCLFIPWFLTDSLDIQTTLTIWLYNLNLIMRGASSQRTLINLFGKGVSSSSHAYRLVKIGLTIVESAHGVHSWGTHFFYRNLDESDLSFVLERKYIATFTNRWSHHLEETGPSQRKLPLTRSERKIRQ